MERTKSVASPTWRGNVLLLLLSTVGALLIAEGLARFMLYQRTPKDMIFVPEMLYTFRPAGAAYGMQMNDIGCIGDDVDAPKMVREKRVLLLGGSTSFSSVYVESVKRTLVRLFPNTTVRVVSCGRPRYTSYMNRVQYEKKLAALQFDVVFIYMGINDNIYNSFPWVEDVPNVGYFNWTSTDSSVLARLVRYYVFEKSLWSVPDFHHVPLRSPEKFERNIKALVRSAQDRDAMVLLSTFALSYDLDDASWMETLRSQEGLMKHFWGSIEATVVGVREHNAVVDAVASELELPVVDVARELGSKRGLFADLCHFTQKGNERFGELVGEAISKFGAVAFQPPTGN